MSYPSDLSEAEWDLISPYFEPPTKRGSTSKHQKKQVFDAILYVLKGGITWRMMPNDLPPCRPFMTTSAVGTNGEFGKAHWMRSTACTGNRQAKKRSQAMPSLMRKASKPSTPVKTGALTAARR